MIRSILFSILLLLGGCVTKEIVPEYAPRLITSQNSDGMVFLSWKSEPGYIYRIYVQEEGSPVWRPLERADSFKGTGETINFRDKRNPREPLLLYSLRTEKIKTP